MSSIKRKKAARPAKVRIDDGNRNRAFELAEGVIASLILEVATYEVPDAPHPIERAAAIVTFALRRAVLDFISDEEGYL